jgi:hypothetical protein
MKVLRILALGASLSLSFSLLGCETSHSEKDKPALLGGENHEETTTTHNPITGTDDTTHKETHSP